MKYKIGDIVVDLDEPRYTFKITGITQTQYFYNIYEYGKLGDTHCFPIHKLEESTRHQTKLERALK